MSKVFVIDVAKCNGCYNCQLACKDEHVGNDWSPYAKPQPEIGQFWVKLEDHVRGTIPKVKVHYVAKLCNHCEKPACIEAAAQARSINATTVWLSSIPISARVAGPVPRHALMMSSILTRSLKSARNAPAALICWTSATSSPAVWKTAPRTLCASERKKNWRILSEEPL